LFALVLARDDDERAGDLGGRGCRLPAGLRVQAAMSLSTTLSRPPCRPRSRADAWPSRDFSRMYSRSDSACRRRTRTGRHPAADFRPVGYGSPTVREAPEAAHQASPGPLASSRGPDDQASEARTPGSPGPQTPRTPHSAWGKAEQGFSDCDEEIRPRVVANAGHTRSQSAEWERMRGPALVRSAVDHSDGSDRIGSSGSGSVDRRLVTRSYPFGVTRP
jgi:hypothetical protein